MRPPTSCATTSRRSTPASSEMLREARGSRSPVVAIRRCASERSALLSITRRAEDLKIVDLIGPPTHHRDDVVVLDVEVGTALRTATPIATEDRLLNVSRDDDTSRLTRKRLRGHDCARS